MLEFAGRPSVTKNSRFPSIAALLALLISTQAPQAAEPASWDGAWTGSLGNVSTIAVTIANNKVVSYSF